MWRLLPMLLLLACADDDTGPAGEWTATLSCDDDGALPACPTNPRALIRIEGDDARAGEHRTFLPGHQRPDGSWSGVPGALHGEFVGSELSLTLLGDLDDPFISDGDLQEWTDHTLVVTGSFESVCWDATWAWVHDDGTIDATGVAEVARRDRACN